MDPYKLATIGKQGDWYVVHMDGTKLTHHTKTLKAAQNWLARRGWLQSGETIYIKYEER